MGQSDRLFMGIVFPVHFLSLKFSGIFSGKIYFPDLFFWASLFFWIQNFNFHISQADPKTKKLKTKVLNSIRIE
jgi:hypothetical protein